MDAITLTTLLAMCAPLVHDSTASAVIAVESANNPHAIGVVRGVLVRQPQSRVEALATATALVANGHNFSVGLAQINVANFDRLGLTLDTAFEPCTNLRAMQAVLTDCLERASGDPQFALRRALSCYYSGNFTTGFRDGYVRRVVRAAMRDIPPDHPKVSR